MTLIKGAFTTSDYRASLFPPNQDDGDLFTLPYQWRDKPHLHVRDLCEHIDKLEAELERLRAINREAQGYLDAQW